MDYTPYTVRFLGIPIGVVVLGAADWVSAGPMKILRGYESVRGIVRDGSEALLSLGFFAAASREPAETSKANVPALNAAARLTFELTDEHGNDVPATFVNLLEPPDGDRVIVFARLSHAHSRVAAETKPVGRSAGNANAGGASGGDNGDGKRSDDGDVTGSGSNGSGAGGDDSGSGGSGSGNQSGSGSGSHEIHDAA